MTCNRKKSGFTLVEILITVAIIAILVAIAIPSAKGVVEKAQKATCDANLEIVRREMVTRMMLEPAMGSNEKDKLAQEVMVSLKAEPYGYGNKYTGLCPCGGVYTITFVSGMTVAGNSNSTQSSDGYDRVYIFCSKHNRGEWVTGVTYAIGDTMTTNGYIFKCIRANTSGSTSRTRNPSLRSNKSTWEVIGFSGKMLPYSSTVRYAVGFEVVYKNHSTGYSAVYRRKDFNMVGGQVPYDGRDSDYWELITEDVAGYYDDEFYEGPGATSTPAPTPAVTPTATPAPSTTP